MAFLNNYLLAIELSITYKILCLDDIKNLRVTCKSIYEVCHKFTRIFIRPVKEFFDVNDYIRLKNSTIYAKDKIFGISFGRCVAQHSLELMRLLDGILELETANCETLTDELLHHTPTSLTALDMTLCRNVTDEGLTQLPENLKVLKISQIEGITGRNFSRLPKQVLEVDIHGCNNLLDDGICMLSAHIAHIDISNCPKLTDKSLYFLSKTKVIHLDLQYLSLITDAGLRYFGVTIRKLNLTYCTSLSERALEALQECKELDHLILGCYQFKVFSPLQNFTKLTYLNASDTQITDSDLIYLPQSLTELDLSSCEFISNEGLKYLPKSLKRVNLRMTKISQVGLNDLGSDVEVHYDIL